MSLKLVPSETETVRKTDTPNGFSFSLGKRSSAVFQSRVAGLPRTVHATEDLITFFHAVANYSATAMRTLRRNRMDRAFETVEDMPLAGERHLERFVVVVTADFASCLTKTSPPDAPPRVRK